MKICHLVKLDVGVLFKRIIERFSLDHFHSAVESYGLERQAVLVRAKVKAVEYPCEKLTKIMHSCITKYNQNLKISDTKLM